MRIWKLTSNLPIRLNPLLQTERVWLPSLALIISWFIGRDRDAGSDGHFTARFPTQGGLQTEILPINRAFHVLVDLGWIDFDFFVPPSCPATQPLLPKSHQPKQSLADSGTLEIQVNKTQSTSTWDALYSYSKMDCVCSDINKTVRQILKVV